MTAALLRWWWTAPWLIRYSYPSSTGVSSTVLQKILLISNRKLSKTLPWAPSYDGVLATGHCELEMWVKLSLFPIGFWVLLSWISTDEAARTRTLQRVLRLLHLEHDTGSPEAEFRPLKLTQVFISLPLLVWHQGNHWCAVQRKGPWSRSTCISSCISKAKQYARAYTCECHHSVQALWSHLP